jgi:hypothetical protein
VCYLDYLNIDKTLTMRNHDIKNDQLKKHLKAIDEHKSLMNDLHKSSENHSIADLKASLEKMVISLEEYLKVIGLP